jgi:hypothetical protein
MPTVLVVPGLLAHAKDALAQSPLFEIARLASSPIVERQGIDAALCAACDLSADLPTAPLAALGAGVAPADDVVVHADPMTFVVGHADVVMAGRVDDLTGPEAARIVVELNRHFATDGMQFVAPRSDRWFAHARDLPTLAVPTLDQALGPGLRENLPRGAGAPTWNRWHNEVQMLLHEHPVNLEREARGAAPVNGFWFWGAGRVADLPQASLAKAFATTTREGDVARGLGIRAGVQVADLPSRFDEIAISKSGTTVVALSPRDAAALDAFERDWLAPAAAALRRGSIDALEVVTDGHGAAVTWRAVRPNAMRRVIARVAGAAFDIPGSRPS